MLSELMPGEFHKVSAFFTRLEHHLALDSILAGRTPARVFVDRVENPQSVFTGFHARWFLLGSPGNLDFNQAVRAYLEREAIPQAQANGLAAFVFYQDSEAWLPQLELILAGRYPLARMRQYYRCTPGHQDWRGLLPEGYQIRPVDGQLLADTNLKNRDQLIEEICSEQTSVEDFLAQNFGFAALRDDELAGWCLSEYNYDGRCEVGVATGEGYQRRGLGAATTLALLDHAWRMGYRQVGWHCWSDNLPSAALALRAGFRLVAESPAHLCLFDVSLQMALHGRRAHQAGDLVQALEWYARARNAGEAPAWVYYNNACCLALNGETAQALTDLEMAIARGFGPPDLILEDPDLTSLHGEPGWQDLLSNQKKLGALYGPNE